MLKKIRSVTKQVGRAHGLDLYQKMVVAISEATGCDFVFIAKLNSDDKSCQTLALSANGKIVPNISYKLAETPCEAVSNNNTCIFENKVTELFPKDQLLVDMSVQGYIGTPLYDSKGQVEGLFVALHSKPIENKEDILLLFELATSRISVDIELATQEEMNEKLSKYEPLTGFYNKTTLRNKLANDGEKSLLIFSINNFSVLNEAYGMIEVDKILKVLADIIKETVDADFYGNIGPSKFVVLFNQRKQLQDYIFKIRDYFSHNEVKTESLAVFISFSFGGAIGEGDLIRFASIALKKSQAIGSYNFFITDLSKDSVDVQPRHNFIQASNIVHMALENDLLVPYFQGIRHNALGKITKYEVLARIHYEGRVISPYNFIEAAKYSGFLPRVTQKIIEKSFTVMSQYDYDFSINITEDDLSANYLSDFLLEQCQKHKIIPERISLEILEGISSSSKEGHIEQIKNLKNEGFNISIDDFGAEYSNFERLVELEVDYIKIDARYIKNITNNTKSYEIVKAIAYFCKNIGIESVAEHVSTPEIQEVVTSLGINYSQGFLFSEPEPFNEPPPPGRIEVFVDDTIKNLIIMKVYGHYHFDMDIESKFIQTVKSVNHLDFVNVIFDANDSDFFQVNSQDIIEEAKIDSHKESYKIIEKCAVISNDDYSKYITQLWCDHLEGPMIGKVCQNKEEAISWFNS